MRLAPRLQLTPQFRPETPGPFWRTFHPFIFARKTGGQNAHRQLENERASTSRDDELFFPASLKMEKWFCHNGAPGFVACTLGIPANPLCGSDFFCHLWIVTWSRGMPGSQLICSPEAETVNATFLFHEPSAHPCQGASPLFTRFKRPLRQLRRYVALAPCLAVKSKVTKAAIEDIELVATRKDSR